MSRRVGTIIHKGNGRLHGMPTSIISDKDPRFISRFWKEFQKALESKLHLSSTYYP